MYAVMIDGLRASHNLLPTFAPYNQKRRIVDVLLAGPFGRACCRFGVSVADDITQAEGTLCTQLEPASLQKDCSGAEQAGYLSPLNAMCLFI
jgi:hypothetical protein